MQRFDAAEVAAREIELRDVALGRRPQRSRRRMEVYDSEQVDEDELARRRKVTQNMRRWWEWNMDASEKETRATGYRMAAPKARRSKERRFGIRE